MDINFNQNQIENQGSFFLQITLDAKAIYMPKIIDRYGNSRSKTNTANKTENKAYEICICRDSNRIFISNDGCLTSAGKEEDCGL